MSSTDSDVTARAASSSAGPVASGRKFAVPHAPFQAASPERAAAAVSLAHVSLAFDEHAVLRDLNLEVRAGHMTILIGASGSGKSVILKLILGLLKPDEGEIRVNGARIDTMSEAELMRVRDDIGVLFQEGALFDSLTVGENVGYKLYEDKGLPLAQVRTRVEEVLSFIGMSEYIDRLPAELSGGQRRRVAIARAMASRPQLLLFDEPTSGLDPLIARTVDAEILKLRDLEGVTSLLVTHQLQDAFYIATHEAVRHGRDVAIVSADQQKRRNVTFVMLKDGGVYFEGSAAQLRGSDDPYLATFLSDWIPPLVA